MNETEPRPDTELERLYNLRQSYVERIGRLARAAAILHHEQDVTLTQLISVNDRIREHGEAS